MDSNNLTLPTGGFTKILDFDEFCKAKLGGMSVFDPTQGLQNEPEPLPEPIEPTEEPIEEPATVNTEEPSEPAQDQPAGTDTGTEPDMITTGD